MKQTSSGQYKGSWLKALPYLAILVLLALWQWQASSQGISSLLFPPPTKILSTMVKETLNGSLLTNLAITLQRLFFGFLIGSVSGMLLGLVMGLSRPVRTLFEPFVSAIHPMPKIALLPLIMIFFGIGEMSKIVAIALGAFFPLLINSLAGVNQIRPIYFEVAQNYGANRWKTFTRIVVPGSLPLVLSGFLLALNTALLMTISVELVSAHEGLGAMIWLAWQTLRTEELYVALIVIALLGLIFNFLFKWLKTILSPWNEER
jgi:ABC-type nitrate/sulfonate/bicarbonate transport system permease component